MIVLTAAYGRKYKTLEEAEKDWLEGKDFGIVGGPYCSIRDTELFKQMGHAVVIMAGERMKLNKIVILGS